MNLENTLMPEGLLGPVTIKLVNQYGEIYK
jgi:hypothetical protein